MLFCEECRLRKKWTRPRSHPFHTHEMGTCEVCRKHKDCYNYPALFLKPESERTPEEKLLDKAIQQEYHQKAEELVITFVTGPRAGAVDHQRSNDLKRIIIKNGTEVDWYATYELRRKVQEGYGKLERR